MTGAECRKAIERLGLTQMDAARMLGVNGRTVRRWLAGEVPIPHAVSIVLTLMQKKKISADYVVKVAPAQTAE